MTFVLRGPLRRLVGFRNEVHIEADTVDGGIRALCSEYPQLRNALLDASGQLRGVHRLALNRIVLSRTELGSSVKNGDVVDVVTTLAGG
jgi:molybdopterin converting factor small subunit